MTNRVLIGERGGDYGIWVSKPGLDVETCSLDEMLLNTSDATYQAALRGYVDFTTEGQIITIPHSLDYIPMVDMFISFPGRSNGYGNLIASPIQESINITCAATATTLTFSRHPRDVSWNWNGISYHVFRLNYMAMPAAFS